MTPSGKAKELIEKYCQALFGNEQYVNLTKPKECALIAVEEIIKVYEHIDENVIKRKEEYRPLEEYDFWRKVKEEIIKL